MASSLMPPQYAHMSRSELERHLEHTIYSASLSRPTPPPSYYAHSDIPSRPQTRPPSYLEQPAPTAQEITIQRSIAKDPPLTRFDTATRKIVTHDPRLNRSDSFLYAWLLKQTSRTPGVALNISGFHEDADDGHCYDFSFTCDLTYLLDPQPREPLVVVKDTVPRFRGGTRQEVAGPESSGLNVREWCRDYVRCRTWMKKFRVKIEVGGISEERFFPAVMELVKSTGFLEGGKQLQVKVIVGPSRIVVAPKNVFTYLEQKSSRWWEDCAMVLYSTCLWPLLCPIWVGWMWLKRWDVVEARYEVIEREGLEEEWAERWGATIVDAVQNRRSDGWSVVIKDPHAQVPA